MKKCELCGHVDETGAAETCPMCGEATWEMADAPAPADAPADAPKKGRKKP